MSTPNNTQRAAAAATEEPFISEKWATKLVGEGLLSPVINNKRDISKDVLTSGIRGRPFWYPDNLIVKKAALLEYEDPTGYITIPETLGPAVFEFLGFASWQASFLWVGFLEKKAELDAAYEDCWEWTGTPPILKFAIDHVKTVRRPQRFIDEATDELEQADRFWLEHMLRSEFVEILLDPELELEREYDPLHRLVAVILRARWHTLEHLDDCAREREAYLRARRQQWDEELRLQQRREDRERQERRAVWLAAQRKADRVVDWSAVHAEEEEDDFTRPW
ncbi:hypothetical protein IWZ01DRAFT_538715 [Phyllosticta capitalensis]